MVAIALSMFYHLLRVLFQRQESCGRALSVPQALFVCIVLENSSHFVRSQDEYVLRLDVKCFLLIISADTVVLTSLVRGGAQILMFFQSSPDDSDGQLILRFFFFFEKHRSI